MKSEDHNICWWQNGIVTLKAFWKFLIRVKHTLIHLTQLSCSWVFFRPLSGLQEIPVATREESGVLRFPSQIGYSR